MQRKVQILYTVRKDSTPKGEIHMGTERESEQEQDKYSFMQENIKDEKLDPKKLLQKIAKMAGFGLAFGLTACVGFYVLKPWAETTFQKHPKTVEIPNEDETKEDDVQRVDTLEVVEPVQQELTIEDYLQLNEALNQTAYEIEKCIVAINGISQDASWGDMESPLGEDAYQTSGVIVADNGRELLILSNYSSMKQAHLFQVKFIDGTEHEAVMKQKDGNTNLAIFSVAKSGISESSMNKIKIAVMGNSNVLKQGTGLIALGSPFGSVDGLGYGIASTLNQSVVRADGKYNIIITDMPHTENANGMVFDINGKLMGIIDHRLSEEKNVQTLAIVGISSIKEEIELMSNGKYVPYVGIIGITITKEMSETYGIPTGLFVQSVEVDSPAMKAGIQSGDVINEAAGKKVDSLTGYHEIIINQEAGKTIKVSGQRQGAETYVDIKFNVTIGINE